MVERIHQGFLNSEEIPLRWLNNIGALEFIRVLYDRWVKINRLPYEDSTFLIQLYSEGDPARVIILPDPIFIKGEEGRVFDDRLWRLLRVIGIRGVFFDIHTHPSELDLYPSVSDMIHWLTMIRRIIYR